MATTVKELRRWLAGRKPGEKVAIDDGGMGLVVVDGDLETLLDSGLRGAQDYIEVGGTPRSEEKES